MVIAVSSENKLFRICLMEPEFNIFILVCVLRTCLLHAKINI